MNPDDLNPEAVRTLASLDRIIHEPARSAVMPALVNCESADFLYLRNLTGLTQGNLSGHLSKLETAGLIRIKKQFRRKTPVTTISGTEEGRRITAEYWQKIESAHDTLAGPYLLQRRQQELGSAY